MLSCFNLEPGEDIQDFAAVYADFVGQMKAIGLIEGSGPIGQRQSDTPMDTDQERDHQYFTLMSFRDRAQADAAYAHIQRHVEPGDAAHDSVYRRVRNPVFICWRDLA